MSSILKNGNRNINISVTDLAPICGMDHYNNFSKVVCKIWKQLDNVGFKTIEAECRKRGRSLGNDGFIQKVRLLEQNNKLEPNSIVNKIVSINQKRFMSSKCLVEAQQTVLKDINSLDINDKDKEDLKSLVQSASNTVYGSRNEMGGIEIFTKETGESINCKQTKFIYPFYTDTTKNIQWNLIGKIDGLTNTGNIVEVKNRQKELFNIVRDYEMCQIQSYLHMSDSTNAYLVEVLKKGGQGNDFNIIKVAKDPLYFQDNISMYLNKFVKYMSNLVWGKDVDESLRLAVVGGDIDDVGKGIYYL